MKITFLGGGNMAVALIGGLIRQDFSPANINVVELQQEQREKLASTYGIHCFAQADASALAADVILLAVKPQQMQQALAPFKGQLQQQTVVSIAAGLPLETLSNWLGGYRQIVRTMPNTPALIGAGITGMCALPEVTPSGRRAAEQVLQAAGTTLWVEDEAKMDAITAISGSGPAYLFLFIEALQQAGVELGFSQEQARQLALETTLGAARLAAGSTEAVEVLRQRVTSKGGTTEAALNVMAEKGVLAGIVAGAKAAEVRGQELARMLGDQ